MYQGAGPLDSLEVGGTVLSGWLIAVVGVIYLAVAIDQYSKDAVGMAITYLGYAAANVGMFMLSK